MSVRLSFAFLLAAAFFAAAIAGAEPRSLPLGDGQALPSQMPGNSESGLSAEDLQELVAPIAIYPDPLLAIMLESSIFPDDVAAAVAFVNAGGTAKTLEQRPEAKSWDEAVVALVAIPDALKMLHAYPEWAAALGTAFLTQSEALMEAVQEMRRRAWDNGSLHTTPQQVVVREEQTIIIRPANPQVIYVPVFNPYVVFAPVVVVRRPDPVAVAVISFGVGVVVGGVIWSNSSCNWRVSGCWGSRCWNRGPVVNNNNNTNINVNINNPRPPSAGWPRPGGDREPWRPAPDRPGQGRDFLNRPGNSTGGTTGGALDRWRGVGSGSASAAPSIPGRDRATPITRANIPTPGERRPNVPSTPPSNRPSTLPSTRPSTLPSTRPAIPTPTPIGGNRPTLPRGTNLDRPAGSGSAFDQNRRFPSPSPAPAPAPRGGQGSGGFGLGNRTQPAMRPAPAPASRPTGGGRIGGGSGGGSGGSGIGGGRGGAAPLGGGRLGGR